MSTFIALNIEPDEDSDDEIDDTKEIQIEEALKLYQTALKLHSQGPSYYDQAEQAYQVLFHSEIFKYPESLSESKHLERYGQAPYAEYLDYEDSVRDLTADTAAADGTPSTLPQILYLAYKNYGHFKLDHLKHQVDGVESLSKKDLIEKVAAILLLFAEALERDDTDAETWRHTSKIGGLLGSTRIARFCLEAVLDANESDIDDAVEHSGLEEAFAVEELKDLLGTLADELSQSQPPLSLLLKRKLPSSLKKHSKLYPFLRKQAHLLSSHDNRYGSRDINRTKHVLHSTARTWAAVGKSIVGKLISQQHVGEQYITAEFGPGVGFVLELPGDQVPNQERSPLGGTDSTTQPVVQIAERAQNTPLEAVRDRQRAGGAHTRRDAVASFSGRLTNSDGHDVSKFDGNVPEPQPVDESQSSSILPKDNGQSTPQQIEPIQAGELVQAFAERSRAQVKSSPSLNTLTLPTRKRSSDSAGNQEPVDGGRIRSKRIRARESIADGGTNEEATGTDIARYVSDQLESLTRADHWMFEVVNGLLSKLGVFSLGSLDELRTCISKIEEVELVGGREEKGTQRQRCTAIQDLRQVLQTWTDEKGNIVLAGKGVEDASSNIGRARNSGLTIFLEHSKRHAQKATTRPLLSADVGLARFQEELDRKWLSINEVAFRWIRHLLLPTVPTSERTGLDDAVFSHQSYGSTYTEYTWPEPLKEAIVQILVGQDDYIYKAMEREPRQLELEILCATMKGHSHQYSIEDHFTTELVETIFELHLDVYASITNPSSEVDIATRILQRDRLARWARLASELLNLRPGVGDSPLATDTLTLRHLWAATFFANMSEGVSREHVMLCLADLNQLLEAAGNPVLELQNNAVMPEVSAAAAEREMSRLTTMDFFLGIFSSDDGSPVAVIESLEPILDPMRATVEIDSQDAQQVGARPPVNERDSVQVNSEKMNMSDAPPQDSLRTDRTQSDEMSIFLQRGSASLRLFLWRRLRDAYEAINYPPKVFSCYLRGIEIIMTDLKSASYLESAPEHRQSTLLKWIRCLDDFTVKALTLVLNEPSALDCMDVEHLRVSMTAVADLSRLLHSFTMYEDSVRVGQVMPSSSSTYPSMLLFANKLREMHVRTWIVQYELLKAAISQNQGVFVAHPDELIDYLRVVHYVLGLRSYCKLSNKVFLKFMKAELLRLSTADTWGSDFAQVIYDLHGLKLCPSAGDLQDHGCPADALDCRTAIQIMDFVMKEANKINPKDLLKTDLKSIIDKMQQVIGAPKQINALALNKRILTTFLKSPINPIDLYRSLKGVGDLSTVPVGMENAVVAEKGWYFLLGSMDFQKFCSQKRVASGSTDDLDFAHSFFKLDLEFNIEKWETWYRLAVVYDTQLEEDVLWSAEKINNNNKDLVELQRKAIHCYTMALATAVRCGDRSTETASKVSDLYTKFGFRVYASTREPFSMEAFSLRDFTRFFSAQSQGMYKERPFRDLKLFPAWNFAAVLFRKALVEKPEKWINHYMLAKCLWKMYSCEDSVAESRRRPDYQDVLYACVQAIDTLPERKDNRQEAILEPHYKLVTIVHKLVKMRKLQPIEASDFLLRTPYARKILPPEDPDSWETYILQVLKALRTADKSNWHHRMVARAAHVIYDDSADDVTAAMGAKHEFTQQIFTKTMTLQVWKPEHERAGRHFVYTSRYVSFFVRLLVQLGDRASLEALTKRVRKKAGEYVGFAKLWQDLCLAYLKLLRRLGHIPEGHEDTVFKSISHEEFQVNASRLETWCHLPDTYSPIIDILRDMVELKKLNTSLMKPTLIDDLIFDTYAMLYGTVVPELAAKASGQESRERMRVDHLLMSTDDSVATPPPSTTMTPDPAAIKHRTKGVGRKELLRKAEAVVTKPSVAAEVFRIPSAAETSISQQPAQEVSTVKDERGKEDMQGSSAPGSVHDSADDESELSEIEEEPSVPVVKAMFPNLVNNGGANGSATDVSERMEGGSPHSPSKDLRAVDEAGTDDQ